MKKFLFKKDHSLFGVVVSVVAALIYRDYGLFPAIVSLVFFMVVAFVVALFSKEGEL